MLTITSKLKSPERLWWASSLILLGLLIPTAIMSVLDPTKLHHENIWAKPLKFELSLAIHFITLAIINAKLSPSWRSSRLSRWNIRLSTLAIIAEMTYILIQASRHQASHFNKSTLLYAFMYFGVMATGALIMNASTIIVALATWRDRDHTLHPTTRQAIILGLLSGSIMMLIFASYMSQNMSHHLHPHLPSPMPITGWSTRAGDLRPAHFMANHTIQLIPLIGALLARYRPNQNHTIQLALITALWCCLCTWIFLIALSDLPLL